MGDKVYKKIEQVLRTDIPQPRRAGKYSDLCAEASVFLAETNSNTALSISFETESLMVGAYAALRKYFKDSLPAVSISRAAIGGSFFVYISRDEARSKLTGRIGRPPAGYTNQKTGQPVRDLALVDKDDDESEPEDSFTATQRKRYGGR